MGRLLIIIGICFVLSGVMWQFGDRFGIGRLPGDLTYQGKGYEIRFPIVTCLILSVVLSAIFWLIRIFRGN